MTRFTPIALVGLAIVGLLIAGVTLIVIRDDGPPDADVADEPDELAEPDEPTPTTTPTPAPTPEASSEDARTSDSELDGTAESDRDGVGDDRDLADRDPNPPGGDATSDRESADRESADREIAGRQPRTGALPNTGGVAGPLVLAALAALAGGIAVGGARLAARRPAR